MKLPSVMVSLATKPDAARKESCGMALERRRVSKVEIERLLVVSAKLTLNVVALEFTETNDGLS